MTFFRTLCMTLAVCVLLVMSTHVEAAQDDAGIRAAIAAQRALPTAPRLPRAAFLENRTLADVQLSLSLIHI